jgi:hypothetical protein
MTTLAIHPLFAAGTLQFAFEKATTEGKITVGALFILSFFSWTIIITKFRQLWIARRAAKKFFAAYGATRDPLDIKRKGATFRGAPAYQLYIRGADELDYHLEHNPVTRQGQKRDQRGVLRGGQGNFGGSGRRAGDVIGKRDDCACPRRWRAGRSSGCWARCGA